MPVESIHSLKVFIGSIAWFLLALFVGASGLLASIPPLFPQVVLLGLVATLLSLFWKSAIFRQWALSVDIRLLVLIHLSRFIGMYFLVLHSRGELPYAFAVPGGWGDIAVAATALVVLIFSPTRGVVGWAIYSLWNMFGLLDILLVVGTAARLGMANPGSMSALTRLPLSLLPTFLVPIIVSTHIIVFARLVAGRKRDYRIF